jgi:hypothetical protein
VGGFGLSVPLLLSSFYYYNLRQNFDVSGRPSTRRITGTNQACYPLSKFLRAEGSLGFAPYEEDVSTRRLRHVERLATATSQRRNVRPPSP